MVRGEQRTARRHRLADRIPGPRWRCRLARSPELAIARRPGAAPQAEAGARPVVRRPRAPVRWVRLCTPRGVDGGPCNVWRAPPFNQQGDAQRPAARAGVLCRPGSRSRLPPAVSRGRSQFGGAGAGAQGKEVATADNPNAIADQLPPRPASPGGCWRSAAAHGLVRASRPGCGASRSVRGDRPSGSSATGKAPTLRWRSQRLGIPPRNHRPTTERGATE